MKITDYFKRDKYPELKTVIVNIKTGASFRGVIWNRNRAGFLILKNCQLLQEGKDAIIIDGECLIPLSEVEFIQVT